MSTSRSEDRAGIGSANIRNNELLGFGQHSQTVRYALPHVGVVRQGGGNHTLMPMGSPGAKAAPFDRHDLAEAMPSCIARLN
jgi:hypothetical protein